MENGPKSENGKKLAEKQKLPKSGPKMAKNRKDNPKSHFFAIFGPFFPRSGRSSFFRPIFPFSNFGPFHSIPGRLTRKPRQSAATPSVEDRLNTVSESTVSSTELSEFLWGEAFLLAVGAFLLTVQVKIITGSLVILENSFPKNYRYRYRLEMFSK